jgi:phage-related protein
MSKELTPAMVEQSEREQNRPIELYEIEVDGGVTLRYAANNTNDIVFNGHVYKAASVNRTEVEANMESKLEEVSISVPNVDRQFSAYVANGGTINGYTCRVLTVMRDALDDPLNYGVSFQGEIDGAIINSKTFSFRVRSYNGSFNIKVPRRKYSPFCELDFKGEWCGYAGTEALCDRTLPRCIELGNEANYGGFLGVPRIKNPGEK